MLEPEEWAAVVVIGVVLGVVLAVVGAPAWTASVALAALVLCVLAIQRRR